MWVKERLRSVVSCSTNKRSTIELQSPCAEAIGLEPTRRLRDERFSKPVQYHYAYASNCGEQRIRTSESLRLPHFQCGAIDRSANSPCGTNRNRTGDRPAFNGILYLLSYSSISWSVSVLIRLYRASNGRFHQISLGSKWCDVWDSNPQLRLLRSPRFTVASETDYRLTSP